MTWRLMVLCASLSICGVGTVIRTTMLQSPEELLRLIGTPPEALFRPTMSIICGNDQSTKLSFAARLVGAERPLDFDGVNGVAVIGKQQ